jgi:hypothetical protein
MPGNVRVIFAQKWNGSQSVVYEKCKNVALRRAAVYRRFSRISAVSAGTKRLLRNPRQCARICAIAGTSRRFVVLASVCFMYVRISNLGPSLCWHGAIVAAVLFLSFSSICTRAQEEGDVASAARQERARKAARQESAPHVYTDEDLKRGKILKPEDQARVEARKKLENATPGQQDAATVPAPAVGDDTQETESLGEIARRFRQEKQARAAVKAESDGPFTPFAYSVTHPGVAAPKPGLDPLIAPANKPRRLGSSKVPFVPLQQQEESKPLGRRRISPFAPRPLLAIPPTLRSAPAAPDKRAARSAPVDPAEIAGAAIGEVRRVEVQPGESWWRLARRYLGSGARWAELRSLNPTLAGAPGFLKQGATIIVPHDAAGMKSKPLDSGTPVRIRKGDTLWRLAREHLGRGSAWTCLAKMNPEVTDYSRLEIGNILRLPLQDAARSCASLEKRP